MPQLIQFALLAVHGQKNHKMTDIYYSPSNEASIDLEGLFANAWVNCGITGNIGTSYNVSSITDVGTGVIGVNFSTPFNSTNFVAQGIPQITAPAALTVVQLTTNLSVSRTDMEYAIATADPTLWDVMVIGKNIV